MTPSNKGSVIERSPVEQDSETAQIFDHDSVGEGIPLQERLIVSPCPGRFQAAKRIQRGGEYVLEGQQIGQLVSSDGEVVPVKATFAGWIMGYLVPQGCPVRAAEPVAWLRPH